MQVSKPENLPTHFYSLSTLDIVPVVNNSIAISSGPHFTAINNLLKTSAQTTSSATALINDLLDKLCSGLSSDFAKNFLKALETHIKEHPFQTAFLVVGVVLLCNPLQIIGFGSLGPVAGSIAAEWQASIGSSVAANSAFSVLQSWGMRFAIIIPAIGAAMVAAAVVTAVVPEETKKDARAVTNEGVNEVGKWAAGEYGDPVSRWWSGEYGNPVARWWGGEYGNPVASWANGVAQREREREGR